MTEYNGWANYDTWNVALWIGNEEGLYNAAVDYAHATTDPTYLGFIEWMGLEGQETPDGVQWDGAALDLGELGEMIAELCDSIALEGEVW